MRKVFLLTGFQNWGKTWLISQLFSRKTFPRKYLYSYSNHDFFVIPQSNDDLGKERYEEEYKMRMQEISDIGKTADYLFSAFCPTKESNNLSLNIINNLYSNDEVILIPIEYKWCNHAKLQIDEINAYYSELRNVKIQPLSSADASQKLIELKAIVDPHLR